jgi:hypothetical protein
MDIPIFIAMLLCALCFIMGHSLEALFFAAVGIGATFWIQKITVFAQ